MLAFYFFITFCLHSTLTLFPTQSLAHLVPIKALSVEITAQLLQKHLESHKMSVIRNLNIPSDTLSKCRAIGSISVIDLEDNADLQFNFNYTLNAQHQYLNISILARPQEQSSISEKLHITLDFLIAEFPEDYYIFNYNITSYQEHIEHKTTRDYQLIFYLNGFNNFSKSGNITHSYQKGYNLYTVHYMSCEDESNSMGWREQQDYLYFTLLVVPVQKLIQKFKITQRTYSVDWPAGYQYFYGIKGATDEEFAGNFQRRLGGLIFKSTRLAKAKTYGLVLLPYPSSNIIEDLLKNDAFTLTNIIVIGVSIFVAIVGVCIVFYKRCFTLRGLMRWQQREYQPHMNESTLSDLKKSEISRPKYEINTVQEVDEKYESSRKTSRKNSIKAKAHEIPNLEIK